jgi:2-deoxy-D-gluconate 3-dehydrogenase
MILDSFQLHGKVAIVTGCDTGLGQGMACALAQAGADVVGVNVVAPADTQTRIEALGRGFLDLRANLADIGCIEGPGGPGAAFRGHVDILVNNAGIIRREDAIKFSEKDWDDVMDINLKSVFFFSQAAARQFMSQGHGGKIINVASDAVLPGRHAGAQLHRQQERRGGHHAADGQRMGGHGINVNAIAPGYMATNNTAALRADAGRNAAILERIPAGRWGVPEDLAGPVVFLASAGQRLRQRLHRSGRRRLAGEMTQRTPRNRLSRAAGVAPLGACTEGAPGGSI